MPDSVLCTFPPSGKGKHFCWSSWPQIVDTAGKSEHVQPEQHMKYICFSKTCSEKAEKYCQPVIQTWQNFSCCISGKEAFVFYVFPFHSTLCPNLLLNTELVTKVQVHEYTILGGDEVIASKQSWKTCPLEGKMGSLEDKCYGERRGAATTWNAQISSAFWVFSPSSLF